MSKAEIGGHLAFLFFLETIRIDTGQCLNQTCLAVIDVTGGGKREINIGQFSCCTQRKLPHIAL